MQIRAIGGFKALNNPLVFSDPSGLCPECPSNATAGQIYNSTGGATYIYKDGQWTREGGELEEVVITSTPKKKSKEGQEGRRDDAVGQPSLGWSMVPVVGSAWSAVDHFQNGNYWRGTGYTLLAISDVFLVKAAVTAIGKGLIVGGSKLAASNSGRVFWSGGNLAKTEAANFAAENGMKTIEMTTRGSIMNKLTPHLPRAITKPIWAQLSSNFAKGATNQSKVFCFQNASAVGVESVWGRIEYPILKELEIEYILVK